MKMLLLFKYFLVYLIPIWFAKFTFASNIPTRSASNPNPTEPVLNQKLSLDYKEALDTLRLCSIEPVHDNCQDILDFILNHQTFQQLTSNTQVEDVDSYPKAPNRYSTNYKMRKALKGVSGHTSVPKVQVNVLSKAQIEYSGDTYCLCQDPEPATSMSLQTNKLPVTEIPAKSNTVLSDATVLSTHNIPAKSTIKAYPSGVNSLVSYPTPHIKNSNISISQILATPTHEVPLDPEASASHTTTSSIPFIPDLKTKKIASTLANGLSASVAPNSSHLSIATKKVFPSQIASTAHPSLEYSESSSLQNDCSSSIVSTTLSKINTESALTQIIQKSTLSTTSSGHSHQKHTPLVSKTRAGSQLTRLSEMTSETAPASQSSVLLTKTSSIASKKKSLNVHPSFVDIKQSPSPKPRAGRFKENSALPAVTMVSRTNIPGSKLVGVKSITSADTILPMRKYPIEISSHIAESSDESNHLPTTTTDVKGTYNAHLLSKNTISSTTQRMIPVKTSELTSGLDSKAADIVPLTTLLPPPSPSRHIANSKIDHTDYHSSSSLIPKSIPSTPTSFKSLLSTSLASNMSPPTKTKLHTIQSLSTTDVPHVKSSTPATANIAAPLYNKNILKSHKAPQVYPASFTGSLNNYPKTHKKPSRPTRQNTIKTSAHLTGLDTKPTSSSYGVSGNTRSFIFTKRIKNRVQVPGFKLKTPIQYETHTLSSGPIGSGTKVMETGTFSTPQVSLEMSPTLHALPKVTNARDILQVSPVKKITSKSSPSLPLTTPIENNVLTTHGTKNTEDKPAMPSGQYISTFKSIKGRPRNPILSTSTFSTKATQTSDSQVIVSKGKHVPKLAPISAALTSHTTSEIQPITASPLLNIKTKSTKTSLTKAVPKNTIAVHHSIPLPDLKQVIPPKPIILPQYKNGINEIKVVAQVPSYTKDKPTISPSLTSSSPAKITILPHTDNIKPVYDFPEIVPLKFDNILPPKIAPVLEPPHDNPETKINKPHIFVAPINANKASTIGNTGPKKIPPYALAPVSTTNLVYKDSPATLVKDYATHPTSLTEHVNQYTSIETLKTIGTNPIDPGSKYLTYSPKVNTVEGIVPVLNNAIYPSLKSTNIINEADIKKWGIWKEWKQDKGGDTDDDFDTWKEWKEWCDENEDEDEDNDEDEDEDDDDDNEDDDNDDDEDEEYKDKSGGYDDNDAKSWTDWSNWKDWCQKNNLQENLGEVWKEWKDWKKQTNRNTSQQDSMNPQNSWDNWKDWKDWCAENDMEGSAQEWNSWELWKYETKQDIYTENDDLEESWNEWKEWNSWCKENNIDLTETPGFESLEHKKLIEKQTWEAWKKMKSIVKSGTEKE